MTPDYEEDYSPVRPLSHRESLFAVAHDALPPPVHFESLRISEDQLKTCSNKKVRKFYEVIYMYIIYTTNILLYCL
jgi:hypothetical protein